MIVHYKEPIQNMKFCLKTPLQFSKDFIFIPIQFKGNKECIFQTPRMYVPFSKQVNQNDKEYIMISFQNKTNDLQTEKFLDDLNYIYDLIKFEYLETHNVDDFVFDNLVGFEAFDLFLTMYRLALVKREYLCVLHIFLSERRLELTCRRQYCRGQPGLSATAVALRAGAPGERPARRLRRCTPGRVWCGDCLWYRFVGYPLRQPHFYRFWWARLSYWR
mgnify:CR=1 FL=1